MLDPGSKHVTTEMTDVMTKFDRYKKEFANQSRDMQIDLPTPLEHIKIEGEVQEGVVTITAYVYAIP